MVDAVMPEELARQTQMSVALRDPARGRERRQKVAMPREIVGVEVDALAQDRDPLFGPQRE